MKSRIKLLSILLACWAPIGAAVNGAENPLNSVSVSSDEFSFRAEEVPIKQALALFARANNLNIVPDLDIEGLVTVDFRGLPLDLAMQALLDASGYYFKQDGRLIRVRNQETRQFHLDYIQTTRAGQGSNAVQISSGGVGENGGGGSGETQGSTMTVTNNSTIDFWSDLQGQLASMISESGSVTLNSLAGTVVVTDNHRNIEKVAAYLESVSENVVRQVELEVEIYEVGFSDNFQLGIDWSRIATATSGNYSTEFSTGLIIRNPAFGASLPAASGRFTQHFTDPNVDGIIEALKQQGNLKVVSKPRLRTLNNQPAVVRVGQDIPVFTTQTIASTGDNPVLTTNETIQTLTVGTVLSITPQVSPGGLITLDITPAVSRLVRTETSVSGQTSAPVIDIRQASSIVRLRDGDTVVMGGLVQEGEATTTRRIPVLGDIPILGRLFTGEAKSQERTELVFFLTPRIVSTGE